MQERNDKISQQLKNTNLASATKDALTKELRDNQKRLAEIREELSNRTAQDDLFFKERAKETPAPNAPATTKRKATDEDKANLEGLMRELREAERDFDEEEVETLQKEITQLKNEVEFSIEDEAQGDVVRSQAGERVIGILQKAGVKTNVITEADLPDYIGKEQYQELRTQGGVVYGFSEGK